MHISGVEHSLHNWNQVIWSPNFALSFSTGKGHNVISGGHISGGGGVGTKNADAERLTGRGKFSFPRCAGTNSSFTHLSLKIWRNGGTNRSVSGSVPWREFQTPTYDAGKWNLSLTSRSYRSYHLLMTSVVLRNSRWSFWSEFCGRHTHKWKHPSSTRFPKTHKERGHSLNC